MWSFTLLPSGWERSRMMRTEPSGLTRAPSGLERKGWNGGEEKGPAV